MENVRIGRQPVLDSNSVIAAYALMYREESAHNYSSAALVSNTLNKFGTEKLLGDKRAFVRVEEKFLLHDLILTIPQEFFIFSLCADVTISERVIERVELLASRGYILSLEHLEYSAKTIEEYRAVLDKISFLKVDIRQEADENTIRSIEKFKSAGVTIVGDNIYDSVQFEKAKSMGCELFEGYFFAELKIIENAKYEASYMEVLKLYRLLMDDVNIDEITKEFENNHTITVQLLQFINSGAFHFRKKISSVHHILTLVGRIPLAQWLMLMIYSKNLSSKGSKSPLMLMVKNRTELMQSILKSIHPDAGSNMLGEAYFVGVLSLMDTLFSTKLENILQHISISEEVELALLEERGVLGEILRLVRSIEQFETQDAELFEQKHNLKNGALNELILAGIESVQAFANPAQLHE